MLASERATGNHLQQLPRLLQVLGRLDAPIAGEGPERTVRISKTLRDLLDRCISPWLPAIVSALKGTEHPYYAALGDSLLREVTARRETLRPFEATPLDAEGDLLDDPKTGLRQIAEFLASPARTGFILNAQMITRASRSARIPRGFGGRQQMLETLLFSAAATIPAIIGSLVVRMRAHRGWM